MLSYLKKLEDRKKNGSLRSLSSFQGMVDFYSNDYLGLAKSSIATATNQAGSTGSRLISGNSTEAIKAENYLNAGIKEVKIWRKALDVTTPLSRLK